MKLTCVIFDLDDTLLITSPIYEVARQSFGRLMSQQGFSVRESLDMLWSVDARNRPKYGVSPDRLGASMYETYCIMCQSASREPSTTVSVSCRNLVDMIVSHRYRLVWGASRVLTYCRGMGLTTALHTRGDRQLQLRKIRDARIAPYLDFINVVDEKTTDHLLRLVRGLGETTGTTCMVGDEIKADVMPALEVGMLTIRVWGYHELEDVALPSSDRLHNVRRLVHVPRVLDLITTPH